MCKVSFYGIRENDLWINNLEDMLCLLMQCFPFSGVSQWEHQEFALLSHFDHLRRDWPLVDLRLLLIFEHISSIPLVDLMITSTYVGFTNELRWHFPHIAKT